MPLRPLPYREIKRRLEADGFGFGFEGQKGSHAKFSRMDFTGKRIVMVPNHREVAVGTIRSIILQAGMTVVAFEQL